jgi:hypothetical protein
MAVCKQHTQFVDLNLPAEFDGLEGLIQADLKAVVSMVVQRAHERLYLTSREHKQLQAELWNGLVDVLNITAAPLTVENR